VAKEQQLANFIKLKEYKNAIQLAFELDHPRRMLSVLKTMLEDSQATQNLPGTLEKNRSVEPAVIPRNSVSSQLCDIIARFSEAELTKCLGYIREWNTNAKHCRVAQFVLQLIFVNHSVKKLAKVKGIRELLEGLLPYTERHVRRLNGLNRQAFLVEYTIRCMQHVKIMDMTRFVAMILHCDEYFNIFLTEEFIGSTWFRNYLFFTI
jgi:U3 small nucleolar RNA-associated protein 13